MSALQLFVFIGFLFYSLNVTGFRVKNFVLCTSCLKDEPIDLVFWGLYLGAMIAFFVNPNLGRWLLVGVFVLFFVVQYVFTIRFMIWPNEKRTANYNRYFSHSHHIIKASEKRLIPDTFI